MKLLIVGLGKTGFSIAQYLIKKNIAFDVFEEHVACTNLSLLKNVPIFHHMTSEQLQNYHTIYLSPGANPHASLYESVQDKLSNDFNLFVQEVTKPYVVITGSNGKSTLVHLVEAGLRSAGYKAIAIGNNGLPFLDHVEDDVDYFVLELSSYQLELAKPFFCEVAYVSNISQDHLDRHETMQNYAAIKAKIYQNCRYAVVNEEDDFCRKMPIKAEKILTISLDDLGPSAIHRYAMHRNDDWRQCLKIFGRHNQHNALAVMAIMSLLNIDHVSAFEGVANFPGLEHRCEFVLKKNDVTWWNDSKGTNVESTVVAIKSVSGIISGKLVIILGGQGKGQDFAPLVSLLQDKARAIILMGENKYDLEHLFSVYVGDSGARSYSSNLFVVDDLQQVVIVAEKNAQSGDAVLLSPACASLDMFKNYEDRGRQFKFLVTKEN